MRSARLGGVDTLAFCPPIAVGVNQGAAGAGYLYDIVTQLGTEANAAAAASVVWSAGFLALF
jgi:hypothetical protein